MAENKFSSQDLINMGADLFDNKGFDRWQIRAFLDALVDGGYTVPLVVEDVNSILDLIVG